ncbi:hypothetical protein BT93_F3051 [Corymbia citriodora subsp. variegata]|nr:hypothetical protein BT93_F3051 [Corymbia citriodora subsp. variegata]
MQCIFVVMQLAACSVLGGQPSCHEVHQQRQSEPMSLSVLEASSRRTNHYLFLHSESMGLRRGVSGRM